jgi:uncharacterized protein (DUF433 family)
MDYFSQIESNPEILAGKPIIKGTRISVEMILEWFASGATIPELLKQFPQLTEEGIRQALQYAARSVNTEQFLEVKPM